MEELTLYTYCRSSAAYRVRIALNLKKLSYKPHYIHLLKDGGQEKSSEYTKLNPQQLVPTMTVNDDVVTQSLAIIEYLEEKYPEQPLLPDTPLDRAYVRSLAHTIACDIHPINNLRVLNYLNELTNFDPEKKSKWYCHWIDEGFNAIEKRLNNNKASSFCFGEQPTMADVCLIPQVYNAKRFNCNPEKYQRILQIYDNCLQLDAFKQASPEQQEDFEVV